MLRNFHSVDRSGGGMIQVQVFYVKPLTRLWRSLVRGNQDACSYGDFCWGATCAGSLSPKLDLGHGKGNNASIAKGWGKPGRDKYNSQGFFQALLNC